ncbi:ATP-binding protein [Niallia taxi]|nr:ATP-binding protein [Niallia taxi]MDE5055520.1 ATP-binding protein [Niallia taxi]
MKTNLYVFSNQITIILLVFYMLLIYNHGLFTLSYTQTLVPLILFFSLFGSIVLTYAKDKNIALFFYFFLSLISLYLIVDILNLPVTIIITIITGILSYSLFKFYIMLSNFRATNWIKKMNNALILSILFISILSYNFNNYAYLFVLANISQALICCAICFQKEKNYFTNISLKEQKLLIFSLFFSFLPLVLTYSLFQSILPITIRIFSVYFIVLTPITIGVILIERNDIRFDYKSFFANFLLITLGGVLFYLVNHSLLKFSLETILYLIALFSIFEIMREIKKQVLSIDKIKRLKASKLSFNKEKISLRRQITYDEFVQSIGSLITSWLTESFFITDSLLLWKDGKTTVSLAQMGIFTRVNINSKNTAEIFSSSTTYIYQNKTYFKLPLEIDGTLIACFIFKLSKDKPSELEITSISNLLDTFINLLSISSILYQINKQGQKFSDENQENYFNLNYQLHIERFHKDFSLFLHDDVLQNILALKKLTETLETDHLEIKQLMLNTFSELNTLFRDKMFNLYPATLKELSLSENLAILCNKYNKNYEDIIIHFFCPFEIRIPKELQFPVFRTVQELIQNAIKHASPTEINVSVIQKASDLIIEVQDDGNGFNMKKINNHQFDSNHLGIFSITQELKTIGGTLSIQSEQQQGSTIFINIPIH